MDTPLDHITQAGFVILTIVFIGLFILEIRKGVASTDWSRSRKQKFMAVLIGTLFLWIAFVSIWPLYGRMSDFSIFPFNLLPVIIVPIIILVVIMNSKGFGEVLRQIPLANLIRLQSFRFFVEVLLWMLFIQNLLPEQMTFEGRNFDILAGFTAPIIAVLVLKGRISKTGIVVWNLVSLGLLINIVTIAILSTPSPWRVFMNEPANYIVTYFPISWLPGLLVPLAYYLHFFSLKQVLALKPPVPQKTIVP